MTNIEIATAYRNITPKSEMFLVGYQARTAKGLLLDDNALESNIIALRTKGQIEPKVIVVSVDTLFLDQAFVQDLTSLLERPDLSDRILAVASHTHGAPNLQASKFMGVETDKSYRERVLEIIADCINGMLRSATAWSQVVKVDQKKVPCPTLVCRRRVGAHVDLRRKRLRWGCYFGHNQKGIVDPFIRGTTFYDSDGVAAIIWSFAAHPAFYPEPQHIHGDFPAVVRNIFRKNEPGIAIGFFPGLSGSVIPKVNPRPNTGNWRIDLLGRLPFVPGLGQFTMPEFQNWSEDIAFRWGQSQSTTVLEDLDLVLKRDQISNVYRPEDPSFSVEIAVFRMGPLRFVLLSGEPVAAWRPKLKALVSGQSLITGYLAGPAGYLATAEILHEGGYEVDTFQAPFGLTGRVSDEINEKIVSAVKKIV